VTCLLVLWPPALEVLCRLFLCAIGLSYPFDSLLHQGLLVLFEPVDHTHDLDRDPVCCLVLLV